MMAHGSLFGKEDRSGVIQAVIGYLDPVLGENVMAVAAQKRECALSAEELRGFCEGKVEAWKITTKVKFVQNLALNPAGKVLKNELGMRFLPKI